ncbi:MAG TPA: hypothetical protein VE476_12225 [Propionibacteriaceae bacterium]|nr:hypothetical protein [Propionibacteriaceae bacterium]
MTSTIDTIRRESVTEAPPDVGAELCAAHQEAAAIVAELDLGDAALWAKADQIVSDVVAEAHRMTAALTGVPSGTTATGAPPIVRVRELATAQRHLFGVLDTWTAPDQRPVLRESADRVHGLGRWLEHLAMQTSVTGQR